jgi:hypothetical protein
VVEGEGLAVEGRDTIDRPCCSMLIRGAASNDVCSSKKRNTPISQGKTHASNTQNSNEPFSKKPQLGVFSFSFSFLVHSLYFCFLSLSFLCIRYKLE